MWLLSVGGGWARRGDELFTKSSLNYKLIILLCCDWPVLKLAVIGLC